MSDEIKVGDYVKYKNSINFNIYRVRNNNNLQEILVDPVISDNSTFIHWNHRHYFETLNEIEALLYAD